MTKISKENYRNSMAKICLFLFFLLAFFPGQAKASLAGHKDELIVKYFGSEELETIRQDREDITDQMVALNQDPRVEYAEPNYLYQASLIPSDTYFTNQWYLKKISAPQAWNINYSSRDIVIAIIDSGIQTDHPDLKDNIWRNKREIAGNGIDDDKNGYIDDVYGWDFVNNNPDPRPKFIDHNEEGILHGTIVAGVAAAAGNNGIGVSGVAWQAKIMSLKALDDKGEGDTRDIIRAIDYAINNGADIINLSFVGYGYSQSLENAIRRAYNSGMMIVAAAGNEQSGGSGLNTDEVPLYPACHDGNFGENMVIGVSATDALDQKADFSGYGRRCIDISAPGVSIFSTSVYAPDQSFAGKPFNKYYDGYWSGTSMAVPMVSGALSLIAATNPALNRGQMIAALLETADNIDRLNPSYPGQLGSGRLNLHGALARAQAELAGKKTRLLLGQYSQGQSQIRIVDSQGALEAEFLPYAAGFQGRANAAACDIDGDGLAEIITGAGPGGGPQVRIFNQDGSAKGQFFAYNENFRGGINIACADVDGDGLAEIITGAGPGGGPHVRIFNQDGSAKGQFFAYNENFRGGINIACADVDGDGLAEIITGAGPGGGPHVRIFNNRGQLVGQFFAYNENFRGGVNVAAGDVSGDTKAEIITGPGPGGGPQVRVFDKEGRVKMQFFAYNENFRGGINVAAARLSRGSGNKANIITAPGPGGGPHIVVFDNRARVVSQFFAYGANFNGGVQIAAADIDYDGLDEIITGAGPGGAAHVRIFENGGVLLHSFYAYPSDFKGGVSVAALYMDQ